jgi:UDP-glucuronate decarboxylase
VVSNFIVQALRGEDITVYGSGDQTRSFCYVDDLINGIIKFMETDDLVTGPINLGNPEEFTIKALAEIILGLTNSSSKLIFKNLPKDDPKQRKPDISKAKSLLNWSPTVNVENGLANTIEYFRKII